MRFTDIKIGFRLKYLLAFMALFAVIAFIAVFVWGGFIRNHFGDILIVMLIYCFIRIFARNRLRWLPLYIFIFAVLVEIGQYFQLVDLLGLGHSRLARIVIGVTFDPYDILMYFIGCALVFVYDSAKEKAGAGYRLPKNIRRAVIALIIICAAVAAIHIARALTLDRIIEYREITFYSRRLPGHLDGYRIAFVVDVHRIPHEELAEVVRQINYRDVDLLLLGGDFWFFDGYFRQSLAILSEAVTADGIFGVEGNHDDYVRLFAAKEEYGIVPLSNSGLHIHEGFYLAGLEDLWNRDPCTATAIAGASPDDFVLLLTHNPDTVMQDDTRGADLILAGHTHGGQINFFGIWAPILRSTGALRRTGSGLCPAGRLQGTGHPFSSAEAWVYITSVSRMFLRGRRLLFWSCGCEQKKTYSFYSLTVCGLGGMHTNLTTIFFGGESCGGVSPRRPFPHSLGRGVMR